MVTTTQPFLRIPQMVTFGFNTHMDTQEIRRGNIRALINERFGGVAGQFADAISRPRPNVSEMLAGKRTIGEGIARDIEKILELQKGWLDREEYGSGVPAAQPVLPEELQAVQSAYQAGGPAKQAALASLAALPEQEMALILLMLQSIQSKYLPADPHEHLRTNERRAAEKLVRDGMTEPPEEAPLFSRRKQIK